MSARMCVSGVFFFGLLLASPMGASDTYNLDPVHSEVGFRIRHLVSKVPGRFLKFQGTVHLDESDISKSTVEVRIEIASISTDNEARDKHLRTPEFFDAVKFPDITFKSVAVKELSKGKLEVSGDLTMHGVTKRLSIPVSMLGAQLFNKQVHAGFEGALKLNRSDFGISAFPGMLGEEVDIALNIDAVKVEAKP